MTHQFRFGHTLFPVMSSRQAWRDEVKRAEQCGFTNLTVTDHFRSSGGMFPALVAAYESAPSLRVGTLVANSDFWHPSLLAREVITADVLTDGGFELGLGAGWDEPDYRAMGLERRPARERIGRLEESVQILRQAFAGERVRFEGRHYSVDGVAPWPKPQQARIPILIGGGSRQILGLAARVADTVSIHRNLERGLAASWDLDRKSGDAFGERIGWIREAAGDRFVDLELHALVLRAVFTDRREEAAVELGRANGLDVEHVLASPHYLIGSAEEMAELLLRRRERWGISYWTLVAGNDVTAFGQVIKKLAGS